MSNTKPAYIAAAAAAVTSGCAVLYILNKFRNQSENKNSSHSPEKPKHLKDKTIVEHPQFNPSINEGSLEECTDKKSTSLKGSIPQHTGNCNGVYSQILKAVQDDVKPSKTQPTEVLKSSSAATTKSNSNAGHETSVQSNNINDKPKCNSQLQSKVDSENSLNTILSDAIPQNPVRTNIQTGIVLTQKSESNAVQIIPGNSCNILNKSNNIINPIKITEKVNDDTNNVCSQEESITKAANSVSEILSVCGMQEPNSKSIPKGKCDNLGFSSSAPKELQNASNNTNEQTSIEDRRTKQVTETDPNSIKTIITKNELSSTFKPTITKNELSSISKPNISIDNLQKTNESLVQDDKDCSSNEKLINNVDKNINVGSLKEKTISQNIEIVTEIVQKVENLNKCNPESKTKDINCSNVKNIVGSSSHATESDKIVSVVGSSSHATESDKIVSEIVNKEELHSAEVCNSLPSNGGNVTQSNELSKSSTEVNSDMNTCSSITSDAVSVEVTTESSISTLEDGSKADCNSVVKESNKSNNNVTSPSSVVTSDLEKEASSTSDSVSLFSQASIDSGEGSIEVEPETVFSSSAYRVSSTQPEQIVFHQFEIPQLYVGKLIGKKGSFINRIKAKTNCNVVVQAHTDQRYRFCSVRGLKSEVCEALQMIREQFPKHGYPDFSLEQVPNVSSGRVKYPQVDNQSLKVELPPGVLVEVMVSAVVSTGEVWLQQPLHPSYSALARLHDCINRNYNSGYHTPGLPLPINSGTVCVGRVNTQWLRCQVAKSEESSCILTMLDIGGTVVLPADSLRQIRGDYMSLPFQAAQCCLHSIQPINDNGWDDNGRKKLEELVGLSLVYAAVVAYTQDGMPLINLYRRQFSQYVYVNEQLVQMGAAKWMETPLPSPTP